MNLKELMVDVKTAWIEFPSFSGFEVEVAGLSRKELIALRKACVVTKLDRKTKQIEESLNEDKFVDKFTSATIKDWKGLKLKYLEQILLIDMGDNDPDKELEYTHENAVNLVANSGAFDEWLNEVVYDLENFRSRTETTAMEQAGEVAG